MDIHVRIEEPFAAQVKSLAAQEFRSWNKTVKQLVVEALKARRRKKK